MTSAPLDPFASLNARAKRMNLLSVCATAEASFQHASGRFVAAVGRASTAGSLALVSSICGGPRWLVGTFAAWATFNAIASILRARRLVLAHRTANAATAALDAASSDGGAP